MIVDLFCFLPLYWCLIAYALYIYILYLYIYVDTGQIPSEIAEINSVVYINLNYNKFNGTLPPEYANMTQLVGFCASTNSLTGMNNRVYMTYIMCFQVYCNFHLQ